MIKKTLKILADNLIFAAIRARYEHYGYSPTAHTGNLFFIADEVGSRADGSVPKSVAQQTEAALERTTEILRSHELTMVDIVEVVRYHVSLKDKVDEFLPAKARYTWRPFPARSIIGVGALALPELKTEIRSTATFSRRQIVRSHPRILLGTAAPLVANAAVSVQP
jgi:enamine deaminase RidA (YjgF/YER057c/UK114 family)